MSTKNIVWIIIIFLILTLIFFLYPIVLAYQFEKLSDRGTFGDSFGALNAIISGLAFAGIIFTIFLQQNQLKMQREELALQRKELELTRIELKRSASAQEKSEKALTKQAENMEQTAKISLYSALMTSYADLISKDANTHYGEKERIKGKMKSLSKKLERIGDDALK